MSTVTHAAATPVRTPPRPAQSPTCTAARHGTEAAYSWHGCRCPAAREAWRLYRKRRREGRATARTVDAVGTRRRLQALVRIGWSPALLAGMLGYRATNGVRNLLNDGRGRVHVRTAAAVAALYDRLSMTPGPSRRAAGWAARYRWAPPLAWDDADLDNPTAVPAGMLVDPSEGYDQVLVDRACAGTLPPGARLTQPEREAAITRLHHAGLGAATIATRLGIAARTVVRTRRRLGLAAGSGTGRCG